MFSRRTAWVPADDPLAAALQAHRAAGLPLVDLTGSNPTALGLVHPPAVYAALGDPGGAFYDPDPLGLPAARDAVAGYYAARGASVPRERLCLLASTSEAYAHLLALLCDPGDAVLVPRPGYPLLPMLADLAHVELAGYPLLYDGTWSIDLPALAAALAACPRARAIALVAPNNPTGSYLAPDELAAIDALAAGRGLALLVDEVFWDYPLGHAPKASPIMSPTRALTFVLSGLSKVAALPQLKLAWIAAQGPAALVDEAMRRLELVADAYLSASTPVQRAAGALLAAAPAMQSAILERARDNLGHLRRACAGTSLTALDVQGGWLALVRLPAVHDLDGAAWALQALRGGVLAQPGELYDLEGPPHLALSLITPPEAFQRGVDRLLDIAARVVASGPCSL